MSLKLIANNPLIDDIWGKWQTVLDPLRAAVNQTTKKNWQEWQIPRELPVGTPTSEALLEFAATGRLAVPTPASAIADPFKHPDALRRIRLIADQEELEQALAFPWEQWGVFLHPS